MFFCYRRNKNNNKRRENCEEDIDEDGHILGLLNMQRLSGCDFPSWYAVGRGEARRGEAR